MAIEPLTPREAQQLARAVDRRLAEAALGQRRAPAPEHTRELVREEAARVLAERRANRVPRIPHGCDKQGRHPQAAEACTELGAEEDDALAAAHGVVNALIVALAMWAAALVAWLV